MSKKSENAAALASAKAAHVETLDGQIADLKRKLAARRGQKAYKTNVPKLEAEIARLEAVQALHAEDGA